MTVTPDSVASVAARCLRTTGVIDPDTPLALLGLDSLSTIEMAADLEEAFGCELPADLLTECTDARALASVISVLRATKLDAAPEDPFDAMLADSVLPHDVRPLRRAGISTDLRSARRILLTGATGFLGHALMNELLGSTTADIVCLLRKPGALDRPADALHSARVRIIAGDLSRVRLGLGEAHFNELAGQIDAVVHCGAAVNWVYTYSGLRGANVSGTLELLRLAARGGIPFHFISSLSVCYAVDGPAAVDESFDPLPHLRGIHLGYAQSKVIGEALVNEAGRRGLPVRIYRPALISGHSESGAFNESDLVTALVRGCVWMGTAPDLDWKLDCQPVNLVAKSILELSGRTGPTFHLGHPRPRGWRECVLWMRMYGYDIRLIPYHAWLRQLDAETAPVAASSGAHPLRALRTFFLTRHLDAHGLTLPELYEERRRTSASSARTLATVARHGLTCPALDAALLDTYFTRFRKDGVLPPPTEAGAVAHAQFDTPATILAEVLGRSVGHIRILDSGSEHSIISELTAWRSGRTTGLFRAEATLANGSTRKLRLKLKAADVDVIAAGAALAHLVDPAVGRAYAKWSDRIGFTASHVREIAIYRQKDPRFVRHAPALLGSIVDAETSTWAMGLEELEGTTLLNAVDAPHQWQQQDVAAVVDGLAALHAVWYERESELRAQPWIGFVHSAASMSDMSDLWTALADHAAPAFSSWADPDIASLQRRLIASAGDWWQYLERAPRTLIHHDFNPRNVCLRKGVLCAYDWELAAIGAPQRDLAEFLCFVLPQDCAVDEVAAWVERHRRALACETGMSIDRDAWHRGFSAALYDLLINRLSTYAMVHRIRPQSFLPRVLRTWRALYGYFPLEEHA